MPALRLTPHQDELIEIIATDHPQLQPFIERRQYIVRFELRRILSEYPGDVEVTYRYQGQLQKVTRQRGVQFRPQPHDTPSAHPGQTALLSPGLHGPQSTSSTLGNDPRPAAGCVSETACCRALEMYPPESDQRNVATTISSRDSSR